MTNPFEKAFSRGREFDAASGANHKLEIPLLLNPGLKFNPGDHFEWDMFGVMRGISEQGRATIIMCGLNRKSLRVARFKVAKDVEAALHTFKCAQLGGDRGQMREARDRIAKLGTRQAEFTSMVRCFFERYTKLKWNEVPGMPE